MKYIYFMRATSGEGPIKIGCSDKPRRRLIGCTIWSPVPLSIIAQTEGGFFHERAIHDKFASLRLHGEWFTASDELEAFVAAITAGSSLEQLGIVPSDKRAGNQRCKNARAKQALTVKLTFARKAAEGVNPIGCRSASLPLPPNVEAALRRWSESTDVSAMSAERAIIEAHIAELRAA
jgi:hypothetical protein